MKSTWYFTRSFASVPSVASSAARDLLRPVRRYVNLCCQVIFSGHACALKGFCEMCLVMQSTKPNENSFVVQIWTAKRAHFDCFFLVCQQLRFHFSPKSWGQQRIIRKRGQHFKQLDITISLNIAMSYTSREIFSWHATVYPFHTKTTVGRIPRQYTRTARTMQTHKGV